jgi:tetratricopeptide (TPR) repeat protein
MPEEPTTDTSAEAQVTTATNTPASPPGYALLEEIGRGGMGVVYRARDIALDRDVAVKLLADRFGPDSPAAQRFLTEGRITGQLQHPGIPAVHQVGAPPDGRPFLAMKLIKGSTLELLLQRRDDPTDRGRLLAVFEAVCQAVGYAHAHDVIHRDLKPANVMVGAFGEVQVMDWGLAKILGAEAAPASPAATQDEATRAWTQISPTPEDGSHTQAGSLVGTPAFIAPEQALGEIAKVNKRSDVFGLGALLAVILTGKPPYVGDNAESVRVQAVRGKLDDCFARLEASGAEPELVALCRRCLAFEPADRPADAGEVAQAVAELRAAADERARRAELERVRVEAERATAQAQAAERRKRRRLWLGAAAVLAVAVVGGLAAVVVVQQRANAELAAEQAKVDARNQELAAEQAKVQARFDLAVKAIETFHTGVSEDMLLKNPQFKDLRTQLLKEAVRFYEDLERLLAGQTDAKSRKTLAAGYFQLGELMDMLGCTTEALAVHRKGLAVRRELAAEPGADVETRLDVARSLRMVARQQYKTGDMAGALRDFQGMGDIAAALDAESPTDAVRQQLAQSHYSLGAMLEFTGKRAEALEAYRRSLAIRQKLVDGNPASHEFQRDLAFSHLAVGDLLGTTGKPAEQLESYRKALAINQKLFDANRGNNAFRGHLADAFITIGIALFNSGKPAAALEEFRKAVPIFQTRVDDKPAVSAFQDDLANAHNNIGSVLVMTGKPAEALEEFRKAVAIIQKVADDDPRNPYWKQNLAWLRNNMGRALGRQKRLDEAFAELDASLTAHQQLAESEPDNPLYSRALGWSHGSRGWVRVRAGQPAEAAADLRRALELWAKVPTPDVETQFERARALANLAGLAGDAKSGVTADEAKTFADQSVAALADLVKIGWALPRELEEPDFDALRGRADFQKLVAEVEKAAAAVDR